MKDDFDKEAAIEDAFELFSGGASIDDCRNYVCKKYDISHHKYISVHSAAVHKLGLPNDKG